LPQFASNAAHSAQKAAGLGLHLRDCARENLSLTISARARWARRESMTLSGEPMRPIIAFAILCLGIGGTASEPEYSSLVHDYVQTASAGTSLIEIESSISRGDRLTAAQRQDVVEQESAQQDLLDDSFTAQIVRPLIFASARTGPDVNEAAGLDTKSENAHAVASVDDVCQALYTSAQNNDLPVQFFANLIWQESRLRADDVSKKGAQGIAQFMPETAVEKGLVNPFDPMQALPASARFLRELRLQFGNLGFVAAAYNAGPHRVADWLMHRSSLPQETRTYVVRVTGLSVDAWRNMPVDNAALTFAPQLPCRSLPAYADLEQTQLEQAQAEEAKVEQQEPEELPADTTATISEQDDHQRVAEQKHSHDRPEHREVRRAVHEHRTARREAEHTLHAAHERRRSA
jgi:soluble lytic murein transglycosylase-like protein